MLGKNALCTVLLLLATTVPSLGEEQLMLATGFIWPVLMDGVQDPRANTPELKAETTAQCVDGFWTSRGNDFGNRYCDHGLPNCGPTNCYHPGEDWNACPWGTNEAGEPVYAVANGKVVGVGSLGEDGHYLTIEHRLPRPEPTADYIMSGTTVPAGSTFSIVYSNYLHINPPSVVKDEFVLKGQVISTIAPISLTHLHFEMTTLPMTSASNCFCGYCTSTQGLTERGYIHPTRFIRDHLDDLSASSIGWPQEGRLEIAGPLGTFGETQGVISARVCLEEMPSCSFDTAIINWEADRIVVDLQRQLAEPVALEIWRAHGEMVGALNYPFVDVAPTTWYGEVTTQAWNSKLVNGNGRGFFMPGAQITRAEFVEMLAKVSSATCIGSCVTPPFSDVNSGDWFYSSVRLAYNLGWVKEFSSFRPYDLITRAEAVTVLVRATACMEIPYPILNTFADVVDPDSWFYDAVYQARESGMMSGYKEGIQCNGLAASPEQRFFCPGQAITRAEALKAMFNWFAN